MISLACPHCGKTEHVIKFGTNASSSDRCRCKAPDCGRTFTPDPNSRALTPEKQAFNERALAERIPQSGIARMLKVSRDTVRLVRQKGHNA